MTFRKEYEDIVRHEINHSIEKGKESLENLHEVED